MLYVLVGTRFQVLFHSPPGVLFTFPSQYYTLSVIGEYLGLEGGPPVFPRDSSCPAVLWIQLDSNPFRLRGYHTLWPASQSVQLRILTHVAVRNPGDIATSGLASSAFARHYSRNLG